MSFFVTAVVFALMLGESWLSRRHERLLRAQGAWEPAGDVYAMMAWAYPAAFLAMGVEGALLGPPPKAVFLAGVLIFVAGKAIKYWAISSLGSRWTFRVLVLPQAPLVTGGPYAWLRHPNYAGVTGELLGVAMIVCAPVTGALSLAGFASLLRRRIVIEDRALGRDQHLKRGV